MALQIQNAMATTLLLRPGNVTTPATRLLHYGFRTCGVSSQDYLSSSLSLPPDSEEALSITKTKPFSIRSTANADSVVALFKEYGFSDTQIAKIFLLFPELLTRNPQKVLKPKLDFLFQIGIPMVSLAHIITSNPFVLKRSLRKVIIPCFNLLCSLFGNDHSALASFLLKKRASRIFRLFLVTNTPANVETLRSHGVPDSNIIRLAHFPAILSVEADHFSQIAMKIKKMGFHPQRVGFVNGLRVLAGMSEEKWVAKTELLKKCFGWTDDHQVVALFRKNYCVMATSEEKLKRGFEILVNRVGFTPDEIAKYPTMLGYNFDKRILPRFSVLEILLSKGIINNLVMTRAFIVPEDDFLDLFVKKHQKEFPQFMELYTKNKGLKIED